MKHQFLIPTKWRSRKQELFDQISPIIEEFYQNGNIVTLRQLHYQLVSREIIPNTQKDYKDLGELLSEARYYGFVDWDAIEDRGRQVRYNTTFDNVPHLLQVAVNSYRLDRWQGQEYYVKTELESYLDAEQFNHVLELEEKERQEILKISEGLA